MAGSGDTYSRSIAEDILSAGFARLLVTGHFRH